MREQLALWSGNREAWDAERDDSGLTWSYWRRRELASRALKPFAIGQLIPPEVFSTSVTATMAGIVALCLVLRDFSCIVWTYEQWGEALDCSPRTAGTAARELAAKGWIEIRPHFAEFYIACQRRHAQLPSTFAPGYLMRAAFDVWEAQGRRAKEQWSASRRVNGEHVSSAAFTDEANLSTARERKNCQPDRDPSFYSPEPLPDVSYAPRAYPQPGRDARGSGSLFPPSASPLVLRGMDALAREGGAAVREWAQIIALTLQDALRQAFPAPPTVPPPPKAGRRYAAGKRPLDLVRWRPWIAKRMAWQNRDQIRHAEIRGQLRMLQLREWGVDPNGPPPTHLTPEQLRYWYNHERSCVCAVCFEAREAKLAQ